MRQLSFSEGGFPLTNDRLESMQKAWKELKPLLKLMGNNVKFQYGTSYYGIVNGEIYELTGEGVATATYFKPNAAVVVNVVYEDGTSKEFERVVTYSPSDNTGTSLSNISSDLATAISSLSSLSSTVGTHTTEIAELQSIVGIGTSSTSDTSNTVKKGTIIMWGDSVVWKQTTLNGVKASGIPYGYVPCGDIAYEDTTTIEATCTAWNAYLTELGSTKKLSFITCKNKKALLFSDIAGVNLTDKFVVGASSQPGVQNAGADGKLKITTDNLPTHSHSVNDFYLVDNSSSMIGQSGQTTLPSKAISTPTGLDTAKYTDTLRAAYYTHNSGETGNGTSIDVKAALPVYGLLYLKKII